VCIDAGVSRRDACPGWSSSLSRPTLASAINGAITSRTKDPLAQTTSAPKGIPSVSTPCTTSSPGYRPLSCRRQGRGHLPAPGLLEKLALQVAKSLRCPPCRLGSGTPQTTQKPPDAHPGTRRAGRRVPAPDIAPQRHRWWRRRYHTGAYPARYRASALPTHHVPYATPPSQGGEIPWVKRIHFCIPCSDGLAHTAKVVNA
jgi:hypothetical protein